MPEINRKIQTLRTQFGQEVNKIEKSQSLGDDLIYKPKIWWFSHLDWIGDFMKTRTDSTPLSVKAKVAKSSETATELFEFDDEVDDETETYATIEYETEEIESPGEPPVKKAKVYQKPKKVAQYSSGKKESTDIETIEYTLINEDTSEAPAQSLSEKNPAAEFVEFHEADLHFSLDKCKRRSKTFGKYVSALMLEITDDRLFFELQRSITNSIHEANMKQHDLRKS